MKSDFKGRHFEVCWSLCYLNIKDLLLERGLEVDHSTVNRSVLTYAPMIECAGCAHSGGRPLSCVVIATFQVLEQYLAQCEVRQQTAWPTLWLDAEQK